MGLLTMFDRWLRPKKAAAALDEWKEINERRIAAAEKHAAERDAAQESFHEQTMELVGIVERVKARIAGQPVPAGDEPMTVPPLEDDAEGDSN